MKNRLISKLLSTGNSLALLPLRLAVGVVFVAHGSQKLFGWFDGGGIEGTSGFFEGLGLAPAAFWAVSAGLAEFLGGVLLILGLFTRLAGLLIAGVMATAIFMVHRNAFFVGEGGMEFALTLFTAALAFLIAGADRFSLDRFLSRKSKE